MILDWIVACKALQRQKHLLLLVSLITKQIFGHYVTLSELPP